MKSISKFTIALLLSLLIPTASFSQDTYPKIVNDSLILLTSNQLKQTNLIFAEHNMLLKKTDLLESQIVQYKKLVKNCEENDSLCSELLVYNEKLYLEKLSTVNKQLKKETKKRKLFQFGALGLLLLAIFK